MYMYVVHKNDFTETAQYDHMSKSDLVKTPYTFRT